MATYYLDFEGGNDGNDGTSFANRWKTITSGATSARIAPGDTIRVMGSPAPTSLGINGTWTNGPLPSTKSIVSSTNATPIAVTVTGHGFSTGDTVLIASHTTNTAANGVWEITVSDANTFTLTGSVGNGVGGATGTVRNQNNCRVTLASALTANITDCESAWTAVANVTATLGTTDYKENKGAASVAIAAAFTTGKAAYFATGTLNLSGYQQVSFWIKQTAGTVAIAGDVSIRLCTDTAGATSVHTIAIPALAALNRWCCITVDTGGNLNSAIASVALYVDTDRGAQTFLIDNIIACKASSSADSLTLNSLIGKNAAGETWWGIQSINGTRVMLDCDTNSLPTTATRRGYYGTTETVTTYKRECIAPAILASGATFGTMQDSGTSGSLIAFEGGWDRTNMTTQNIETWVDGRNGLGNGISFNAQAYVKTNKLSFARFTNGMIANSAACVGLEIDNSNGGNNTTASMLLNGVPNNIVIGTIITAANLGTAFNTNSNLMRITTIKVLSCGAIGVSLGPSAIADTLYSCNSATGGVGLDSNSVISTLTVNDNGTSGLTLSSVTDTVVKSLTATGNATGISVGNGGGCVIESGTISGTTGATITCGKLFLRNVTISDPTEVSATSFGNCKVQSENHDGTPGNHQIFCDDGLIFAQATTRHTASGIAWSHQPTSANRNVYYPLSLPLGPFYCAANTQVTVTCWFYRDNTGLTGRLVCKGGQLTGVSSDVIAAMAGIANTWEQLSISFTPTEAGAISLEAQFYGGTTHTGIIDDMEITQGSNTYTISLDRAVLGGPFVWNEAQAGGGGGSGLSGSVFSSPVIRGIA